MEKLDPTALGEFKEKLEKEKALLEKELLGFAKPTENRGDFETSFDQLGEDREDNATEVEEYADNVALEDNLEKQLKEVDEALERIQAGTYGICANCQQPIDPERLRAYPAAKTCLKCK